MKHTPGLLKVIETPRGKGFPSQISIATKDESLSITQKVGPHFYIDGSPKEETLFNAYLIAAAPALLEACEYLTEMAEHTAHDKHNCPEIWNALERAKSAIAQVKGE